MNIQYIYTVWPYFLVQLFFRHTSSLINFLKNADKFLFPLSLSWATISGLRDTWKVCMLILLTPHRASNLPHLQGSASRLFLHPFLPAMLAKPVSPNLRYEPVVAVWAALGMAVNNHRLVILVERKRFRVVSFYYSASFSSSKNIFKQTNATNAKIPEQNPSAKSNMLPVRAELVAPAIIRKNKNAAMPK